MDYYAILNVARDSDTEMIEKSFKKLAITYHPDKANASTIPSGGETEEEKKTREERNHQRFVDIMQARDTLVDPKKRKEYDYDLKPGTTKHSASTKHTKSEKTYMSSEPGITVKVYTSTRPSKTEDSHSRHGHHRHTRHEHQSSTKPSKPEKTYTSSKPRRTEDSHSHHRHTRHEHKSSRYEKTTAIFKNTSAVCDIALKKRRCEELEGDIEELLAQICQNLAKMDPEMYAKCMETMCAYDPILFKDLKRRLHAADTASKARGTTGQSTGTRSYLTDRDFDNMYERCSTRFDRG
ncbi:DnaJ domain-containing protein [Xylaria sp. FL0064]|nr:DnaJ domain-containing protein [Xylaria sp. FL0064]